MRYSNRPRLVDIIYARRASRRILLTGKVEPSVSLWLLDLILEKSKSLLALLWFQPRIGFWTIAGLQFEFLLPLVTRMHYPVMIPARQRPCRLMPHPVKFRNAIVNVTSPNNSVPTQSVNYVFTGQIVSQGMPQPFSDQRQDSSTPNRGFQFSPMQTQILTDRIHIAGKGTPDDQRHARNFILRNLTNEPRAFESSLVFATPPAIPKIALSQRQHANQQSRALNAIQARNAEPSVELSRILKTKLNLLRAAVIKNPVQLNFSSSLASQFKVKRATQRSGRSSELAYPHLSSLQNNDIMASISFHPPHQRFQRKKSMRPYPQSGGFRRDWPVRSKIDAPWKLNEDLEIHSGASSTLMLDNLRLPKISSEMLSSKQPSSTVYQGTKSLFVDPEIKYIHHHPFPMGSVNRSPAEKIGIDSNQSQGFEKASPELKPRISAGTGAHTVELARPAGITRHQTASTLPLNDINMLADEVFNLLEKKLRTERQRRGIFS
jgi:hypothetical protein